MEDDVMKTVYTDKKTITAKSIFTAVAPFASIGILLVIWLSASNVNSELVPTPLMAFDRFLLLFTKPISNMTLFGHIWASLRRVFLALLISFALGIPFGVMIGWNKTLNAIFGTLFELIRPIPPIAWLPIVIMWFGIDELPKVIIVFIGTFMPVVINSYTGIKMVQSLHLDVARMFNANEKQLLLEVAVPAAMPAIFAGIRNATSGGWMVVLAAEMIGAKAGMGFLITRGMEFFDVPLIMVGMKVSLCVLSDQQDAEKLLF
jgi:NitT/TauT family transport system permease protein/sulfonate transport system permease protein